MRLILAAGTTRTAQIPGLSAAGTDPTATVHTPAADAEILTLGDVVRAPAVPVSPTGCPTPAVITRATREVLGFDVTVVDAGLAAETAAPTVSVGARPGQDLRGPTPVPASHSGWAGARTLARSLSDDQVLVAETIPGGTTTAMGILRALGEDVAVSSSLPENPIERKRAVVAEALAASGITPGDRAGDPAGAIRDAGDPVQAVVAGLVQGALETATAVTLAGGTQMLAAVAVLRHAGIDASLRVATTSFVADDPSVDLSAPATDLGCDLVVTDPGFDGADHPALARYVAGEAKEGVGMGGVLWVADRRGRLPAVRERIPTVAARVDVHDDTPGEPGGPGGQPRRSDRIVTGRDDTDEDPGATPADITKGSAGDPTEAGTDRKGDPTGSRPGGTGDGP